jgi:hypothetical protein
MAQEHLSRRILEEAGYLDQASLHNPFDPLGLALSTVIPGGFGAMHMRGEFRRAEGVKARHRAAAAAAPRGTARAEVRRPAAGPSRPPPRRSTACRRRCCWR